MGLFGFGKKKQQKVEKNSNGLPKVEYFDLKWDDEAIDGSPLASYRNLKKMPALRYMPMPVMEVKNQWTGKTEIRPVVDVNCELAQKYPETYFFRALPIRGTEKNFYPFSEQTMQLVENIMQQLENIDNIKAIREHMANHSDDEVIIWVGEWFLGDYLPYETNDATSAQVLWNKMKEREIRLYGEKFGYEHPWSKKAQ